MSFAYYRQINPITCELVCTATTKLAKRQQNLWWGDYITVECMYVRTKARRKSRRQKPREQNSKNHRKNHNTKAHTGKCLQWKSTRKKKFTHTKAQTDKCSQIDKTPHRKKLTLTKPQMNRAHKMYYLKCAWSFPISVMAFVHVSFYLR